MSGRPRTTSFAEGNKPPANPTFGGMKISSEYHWGNFGWSAWAPMILVQFYWAGVRDRVALTGAFGAG